MKAEDVSVDGFSPGGPLVVHPAHVVRPQTKILRRRIIITTTTTTSKMRMMMLLINLPERCLANVED